MTEQQNPKYLVWEQWWSRPVFGAVKSMTYRQWIFFVSCNTLIVIGVAVILASLVRISAGISILFVLPIVLPVVWHFGRQGALKESSR